MICGHSKLYVVGSVRTDEVQPCLWCRLHALEADLAECQKVRDEWCAEYTKLRNSTQSQSKGGE